MTPIAEIDAEEGTRRSARPRHGRVRRRYPPALRPRQTALPLVPVILRESRDSYEKL